MSEPLTYPADAFCPRCQLHLRSQDSYTTGSELLMKPLCPVCADDDARAAS